MHGDFSSHSEEACAAQPWLEVQMLGKCRSSGVLVPQSWLKKKKKPNKPHFKNLFMVRLCLAMFRKSVSHWDWSFAFVAVQGCVLWTISFPSDALGHFALSKAQSQPPHLSVREDHAPFFSQAFLPARKFMWPWTAFSQTGGEKLWEQGTACSHLGPTKSWVVWHCSLWGWRCHLLCLLVCFRHYLSQSRRWRWINRAFASVSILLEKHTGLLFENEKGKGECIIPLEVCLVVFPMQQ